MCYPKPGPRCSNHARKRYITAKSIVKQAQQEGFGVSYFQASENLKKAEMEFYMTPAGFRELERRISVQDNVAKHTMLLETSRAARAEMLKKINTEDQGDTEHKTVYRDGLSKARKTLLPLNNDTIRSSWRVSGSEKAETRKYVEESARFADNLTDDEVAAVRWMTSNGFMEMDELKNGRYDDLDEEYESDLIEKRERIIRMKKTLYEALNKAPQKPRIVYRGLQHDSVPKEVKNDGATWSQPAQYSSNEEHAAAVESYFKRVVGTEITFERPVSTTADPGVAVRFSDGGYNNQPEIVYEISTRKGAAVGLVSAWDVAEKEYVLPPKAKFKVKNVIREVDIAVGPDKSFSGFTIIQLEEI